MIKIPSRVSKRMAEKKEEVRLARKRTQAQRRLKEGSKKRVSEMSSQMKRNMKVAPIK